MVKVNLDMQNQRMEKETVVRNEYEDKKHLAWPIAFTHQLVPPSTLKAKIIPTCESSSTF